MSDTYILDGHETVRVSFEEYLKRGKADRAANAVGKTKIGSVSISTVFLGLDHQCGDGPALLFETMVFGGSLDQECERYSHWEQAEAGHNAMVERVKATEKEPR